MAMHYLPMVKQVAAKMAKVRGMGVYHDVEDLVSMGTIGLIDAIDRYEPSLGDFRSFAWPRVRWGGM